MLFLHSIFSVQLHVHPRPRKHYEINYDPATCALTACFPFCNIVRQARVRDCRRNVELTSTGASSMKSGAVTSVRYAEGSSSSSTSVDKASNSVRVCFKSQV